MLPELRLLAIAGPPSLELDQVVEACRLAAAGGVTAVQLRVKRAPAGRILELTSSLIAALPIPVWVNDRADIALAAGARGVHLGDEDLPPAAVRAFAGDALRIGVSVGSAGEAAAARAAHVDYWSIGSVFATGTKPDAGPPIGTAGFRVLATQAPRGMVVIGIGGITAANAAEVIRAGAAGVAVSQSIFGAPDIERAACALRDAIESAVPR